ncbi:MAG: ATP-binding protein [Pseudomonadota bacterium]
MFPRALSNQILAQFDSPDLIFLLGTRQTGKTTLAHLLAKDSSYSKDETWYFDFEDKQYRQLFNTATIASLKQILRLEGIDFNRRHLLIFDEIQLLDDPSNLLKLLHDHFPALKIIATGSSSLQIKTKFSDSLAGRKRVYLVEPLNFDEFLLFRGEERLRNLRQMFREGIPALIPLLASGHDHFLGLLEEYLIYGGYPEVVLIHNKQEKLLKLDSIANAYMDIREVAKIENLSAYNNLLKYLAINAGAQFNLSSARETIGISSVTLSKYLNLLEETFIVAELPPFFTNRNKEISKSRKIYFKDTGINNLLLQNFNSLELRRDAGALYETYVFNRLNWNHDITRSLYFYRTQSKSEIDFILVKDANYHLIEVKSGKHQHIPRAMIEFEKKYAGQLPIVSKRVINQSVYLQKGSVEFLPAYIL